MEIYLIKVRLLTNIASIHLYENQLTGEIPEELGEFKLVDLSIYGNKFTGSSSSKAWLRPLCLH
jgi:hypothetical protein